jgi:hypothetical protein
VPVEDTSDGIATKARVRRDGEKDAMYRVHCAGA